MTQIASLSHSGVINGNEIDLYVIRAKRNWDKKINVIPEPRSKNHWNRGRKATALDMLQIDILWELTAVVRDLTGSSITNEIVGTGDGTTTHFTFTLAHPPIKKKTFVLNYTYNSHGRMIKDDGNGNLQGDGSGTIDYTTGAVDVTCSYPPENGSSLLADYTSLSETKISNESFKTGALNEWAPLPATGLSNVTIKHDTTTLVEGTDYEIDTARGMLKIINPSYAEQDCTISYIYDYTHRNLANIVARMLEKGGDITLKFNRGMGSPLESTHTVQMNKLTWTQEAVTKNSTSLTISLMELPHR